MENIFTTPIITIAVGIVVYSISRLIEKTIVEPIHTQNQIRGRVATVLIADANLYGNKDVINDPNKVDEASDRLRSLAAELRSTVYIIPQYRILQTFRIVLRKSRVFSASSQLIGLSNGIYHKDFKKIDYCKKQISADLNIGF